MGVITYTYDEYSRISEKDTYDLGTIVYGYDSYGRVGSITTKVNGVEFRGGKKKDRDRWFGIEDKYFKKWWERVGKKNGE